MADADVGKPVEITGGIPLKSMFGPQPIDWRKVAASIRKNAAEAQTQIAVQKEPETLTAIATAVIISEIIAAAIEDGLS